MFEQADLIVLGVLLAAVVLLAGCWFAIHRRTVSLRASVETLAAADAVRGEQLAAAREGLRAVRATQDGMARRLALAEDAAEAAGIDFGAMPALGPPPHNHVWPAEGQWFQQDETSRSYRCQVPRCQRVHTVTTR